MSRSVSIERKHVYSNYYGYMQYDVVRGRQIQASTTNLPGCFILEPNNPDSGTGEYGRIGNRITVDNFIWNVSLRLSPLSGTTTGSTLATNSVGNGNTNAVNDLATKYDQQWYPACALYTASVVTNVPYKFSLKFRYFIIECSRDVYDENIKDTTNAQLLYQPYYQQRLWAWFIGSHTYQNGPYETTTYPGTNDQTTGYKFYNVSNQDKSLRETTPWKSLFKVLKDGSFTMNSSHYSFVESISLNKNVTFTTNENQQSPSGNRPNKHFFMLILPPAGWKDQNHMETLLKVTNNVGGETISPFNALNIQVTANMKNSYIDI